MVTPPLYLAVTCLLVLPVMAGSTVDTLKRQSTEAFGVMLLENVDVFSALIGPCGHVPMRQFTRYLVWWYFYGPLHLAAHRSMLSVPEECSYAVFWEITSGYAVFSSLLGSTVDSYLCQFMEAWENSRFA